MFLVTLLAGALGWAMPFYYSFFNEYSFRFPWVMEVSVFGAQIRRNLVLPSIGKGSIKKTWEIKGQYFLIRNSKKVRVDFIARFHASFGGYHNLSVLPNELQNQVIPVVKFYHSLRSSGLLLFNVLHCKQLTDRLITLLFRRSLGLDDCFVRLELVSGEYSP